MGILDDLLGTKTASGQDAAAASNNALINSTVAGTNADLTNSATNASNDQTTGAANATSALNTGYGNATGALTQYAGQAQGTLKNGVNNAVSTDQSSNAAYQPYTATGGAATGALDNALGLNGASGNAAATAAFQQAPGYQYALDQSTGAAQRAAAAGGMNASGNTLSAVAQLGNNLASQGYQQYLTNLQNAGSQGLQAAQGISSNNQAAGGAQLTGGTTGATLDQSTGTNLGTLDAAQGTGNASIQSNLGNSLANIQTGLGTSLTNNAWNGTNAITGQTTAAGVANDTAANANSGILSKAAQTLFAPETAAVTKGLGGALSSATGGFL
ncbi:hypothetical protein [Beijerinckia sp. L45]|uniref:hypothetical protein n=1 Tax=Beijerinckia sp. L45 TaxID=1641855 RepID=UPI00131CEF99|nr:hypothetical protein [Beijerinckia sp. L45]